jgi:hypothetical protein
VTAEIKAKETEPAVGETTGTLAAEGLDEAADGKAVPADTALDATAADDTPVKDS